MLRFLTAGESHGPSLTGILEGMPAGLELPTRTSTAIWSGVRVAMAAAAARSSRRTMSSGWVGSRRPHTGAPIAMRIENRDYANQQKREKPVLTVPRPGHADLAGATKYRLDDLRTVLERASARETAMRVAVGAIAKRLLEAFGITSPARYSKSVMSPPKQVTSVIRRYAAVSRSRGCEWPARKRSNEWWIASIRRGVIGIRWEGSSRCRYSACPSGSAAMSTGTASSMAAWPRQ